MAPKTTRTLLAISALALIALFCAWVLRSTQPGVGPREVERALSAKGKRPGGDGAAPRPKGGPSSGQTGSDVPEQSLEALLGEALQSDPDGELLDRIVSTLEALPVAERRRVLAVVAERLAQDSPDLALAIAGTLGDRADAQVFATKVVAALLKSGAGEAIRWVERVDDHQLAAHLYAEIGRRWAQKDLPSARSWAESFEDRAFRERVLEGVIFTWAQLDTEGAFAWATAQADEAIQDRLLAKMAKLIATTQPREAAQWASELPGSSQADAALQYAMHQWARDDAGEAAEWAVGLESGSTRDRAVQGVIGGWSAHDPAGAARWVQDWDPMGDASLAAQQERALDVVASTWSARNPEEAMSWVASLDGDLAPLREPIVERIIGQAVEGDPGQLETLLAAISDPELKATANRVVSRAEPPTGEQ